ncbi:C40 family peptidase [Antrihabitans spumae]|uniref:C40 family peptidase n=1 Tax=Antrihabitans spumae TaxID=3373370 RepID=A0ABW7KUE3_9NOCA
MASHRVKRSIGSAVAVGLLSVALAAAPTGTAVADPVALPPGNASDAMQQLTTLARESEQINESLHNAQIDLDKKVEAQKAADAKLAADQDLVKVEQAKIAEYQPVIDRIAVATYQGARPNRLFAVLTSDSPQQMLDQMSALDVLGTEAASDVAEFQKAITAAAAAEQASKVSVEAAKAASEQAKAVSADLQKKQSELQVAIAGVTQAWGALSGAEQAMLVGSAFPPGFDPSVLLQGLIPGSGTGALQAAITRIGSPYVWGAAGPNSFDCSGLVVWAYKQVGKTLPRSSQAQMSAGTPVDKNDLQPGDVVGFYSDASHVGIYAGNGNVLHASTFGVPVAISPMGSYPYYGARRY